MNALLSMCRFSNRTRMVSATGRFGWRHVDAACDDFVGRIHVETVTLARLRKSPGKIHHADKDVVINHDNAREVKASVAELNPWLPGVERRFQRAGGVAH